jgi:putative endonuclease
MRKSARGKEGEALAAAALEKKGMKIIARNARSASGEIDIVALEGEIVVFVEVKTWTSLGFEELGYSVNLKKQRRIIETAKYFISTHREYNCMAQRFDIVFIRPRMDEEGTGGNRYEIIHLASAFME